MGWKLNALKSIFSNNPESLIRFFTSRTVTPPQRNTQEFLEAYTRNPRFSPVTKIATDMSGLTGKLYRVLPEGDKKEIKNHSFLDFMGDPNPFTYVTKTAFWRLMEQYLLIKGEAYALIERDRAGYPAELWAVPPHWVLEIPRLGFPCYRVRTRDGRQTAVEQNDMFVIRELNPLDPYGRGLGQAEQIADELETDEYMAKFAKRFFYNDATPSTIVSAPGMKKDQYQRFRSEWNDQFRGLSNSHKFGIIPEEINVHQLVNSQKEMDFAESRRLLRDFSNAHFGVPPEIMGIVENSNRATSTTAKIIYAENVLMPRVIARQDAINLQLLVCWGDDLLWEFDDVIPQDNEFNLQKSNSGIEKATMTVDEWREQNGLDPLPNNAGDIVYIPFSAIPTKSSDLTENIHQGEFGEYGEGKSRKADKRRVAQKYMQQRQRLLHLQEQTAKPKIGTFFQSQMRDILSELGEGKKASTSHLSGEIEKLRNMTFSVDELRQAIQNMLGDTIDWGGQDAALEAILAPIRESAFTSGAASAQKNLGLPAIENEQLTKHMRDKGLKHVQDINKTTREELARQLADGIAKGESNAQLAERIKGYGQEISEGRAKVIAACETHTSMLSGSYAQIVASGAKFKTWITSGDGDVRDAHRSLNNKTIPINQRFPNGCLFPGDPDAAPAEIVGCRCDLVPGDL